MLSYLLKKRIYALTSLFLSVKDEYPYAGPNATTPVALRDQQALTLQVQVVVLEQASSTRAYATKAILYSMAKIIFSRKLELFLNRLHLARVCACNSLLNPTDASISPLLHSPCVSCSTAMVIFSDLSS